MGLFGGDEDAGKPREFNLGSNPFFTAHLNRTRGPDDVRLGATGALGDLQSQLINQAGLFGAGGGPGAGFAGNQGLAFLQQLAQQGGATPGQLSGTGQLDPTITQGGFGTSLGQATGTVNPFGQVQGLIDPLAVAQSQFQQGMGLLQPQFDKQNLQQESRLHSQGRLGSTGSLSGQSEVEALRTAQGDQQNRLLFDSLNQGLFAQNQGFGQELAGQEQAFGQQLGSTNQRFGQDLSLSNQLFNQLFAGDQSNLQRQQGLFGQQLQGSNQQFGQNAAINELGFNQNLQAGNQLFNFGTGLSQLDPQLRGLFSNLDASALGNALNIQNTAANTFNSVAGAQGSNPAGGGGLALGDFAKAGILSGGIGLGTSALEQAFGLGGVA